MINIPDQRLVPWVVDFVLSRRRFVYLSCVVISSLAIWICSNAILASSIGKMFFGESPRYLRYIENNNKIGSDIQILIGFEGLNPLSAKDMGQLKEIMRGIEELSVPAHVSPNLSTMKLENTQLDDFDEGEGFDEGESTDPHSSKRKSHVSHVGVVRAVHGLPYATEFKRAGDTLKARKYSEIVQLGPKEAQKSLDAFAKDPLVSGLLLSHDQKKLAVVVELYADKDRPAEVLPQVVTKIKQLIRSKNIPSSQVHWGGMPSMLSELFRLTAYNLQVLLPFVIILMLTSIFLLFRLLWPALIAGLISLIGVIWSMAISVLIDPEISIMHSIMPMVIIIVASSDVIHLISAYLIELRDGHDKETAIRRSASEVGRACLYTSMTTFIGFAALSFIPTPVFRQLGIVLGSGVAISLFLAVTIVPPLLHLLPTPTLKTSKLGGVSQWVDRFLHSSFILSTTRPLRVLFVFCVMIFFGGYGLTQLEIENQWAGRMEEDNPFVVDQDWFGDHFIKGTVLQVVIDTQRPYGLLEDQVLSQIAQLEDQIEEDEQVDAIFSLTDAVRRLDKEFRGGEGEVPSDRKRVAEYMLLLETMGPRTLDGLIDFERQRMILSVRMESDMVRNLARFGDGVAERMRRVLHPILNPASSVHAEFPIKIEATGMLYMVGDWLTEILAGQRRGLIFSFILISFMMIIALRSVKIGLLSMIPNLLPLFLIGGLFGLCYDQTDSDALVLAMLAIGIGVDDTIHFLMRLRLEREAGHPTREALRRTYAYAGRGILITTLVLAVGFAPFALSDYWSIMILGTFLPLTLIFALIADLYLVPALTALGVISFNDSD